MKLIVQRVMKAKVFVGNKIVSEIHDGLFVLVGIGKGDSAEKADYLANKLLKLRVMSDEQGKKNLSVLDAEAELLIVSNFTLYANTNTGSRPSFSGAEVSHAAKKIYEHFVDRIKESGVGLKTGQFGKNMNIEASLDGPVTIILES